MDAVGFLFLPSEVVFEAACDGSDSYGLEFGIPVRLDCVFESIPPPSIKATEENFTKILLIGSDGEVRTPHAQNVAGVAQW